MWLGDSLLAVATAGLADYYQHAKVESSFFTSRDFTFLLAGAAIVAIAAYLAFEQWEGAVPEKDRRSIGRIVHSFFFVWMFYMVVSGLLRVPALHLATRRELSMSGTFLGFVAGYVVTQVIYRFDLDPIKRHLMERYPDI